MSNAKPSVLIEMGTLKGFPSPPATLRSRQSRRLAPHAIVLGLLAIGDGASAAPRESPQIPPQLRPWAAWVLDSEEGKNARCPSHAGESSPVCAWPARLALALGERSGSFRQEWTIFKEGFVALPGNEDHWPRDIGVEGLSVPTVDDDGA